MNIHRRISSPLAVLCLLALLAMPGAAFACIWPFQEPAYWQEYKKGPERDALLGGEVGIIDSTWRYPGLYLAWRQFEGLGPIAKQDWPAFWIEGFSYGDEAAEAAGTEGEKEPPKGVDAWQAAMVRIYGEEDQSIWPQPSTAMAADVPDPELGTRWVYFENCLPPAFETAKTALDERLTRWGKESKEFKEWLAGQRQVFVNCGEIGESPKELDASWPAELRADRQYQVAAADFYALRYQAAAERFAKIAADKSSPWSKPAAFALARCTLRQEKFVQAANEFRAIQANQELAEYHASAGRLIRFAELRQDPPQMAGKLEKELRSSQPAEPMALLYDVNWLSGHLEPAPDKELVFFLQGIGMLKVAAVDVYAHWKKSPSPSSLVVAMIRAHQSSFGFDAVQHMEGSPILGKSESEALVAAAAKIQKGSPAYLSARYWRAALLSQVLGRKDEARAELDRLIAEKVGDRGDIQRLRHDRAHLARDWNELIEYGLLTPVGETNEERSTVYPIYDIASYSPDLAADSRLLIPVAGAAINRFASLAEISRLQQHPALPERNRRELALAGFLRAALPGKDAEANAFADAAIALDGELAVLFADWKAAPDAAAKKFTAAFIALRNPGLSIDLWPTWGRGTPIDEIDNLRANWWCALSELPAERPAFLEGKEAPPDAAFGWAAGPNRLGQEVIAYAKTHPDDPRLPEALHLTVKATRYGCYGEPYLDTSKGAFGILHKRFPKSEWTQQTPYYYE
jgi:hypothetical protein